MTLKYWLGLSLLSWGLIHTHGFCPSSCHGHGTCNENDVCDCYPNWVGVDCGQRQCAFGVSWTTDTEENLVKASTPGHYSGKTAGSNIPPGLHAYAECSNKGICDRVLGSCECFDGFTGDACSRLQCQDNCNGHGQCVLEIDASDYYGSDRQLWAQNQYWNNQKTTRCYCDPGFHGADCSLRICPSAEDSNLNCDDMSMSKDVQIITLTLSDVDAQFLDDTDDTTSDPTLHGITANALEQFFALTYTDDRNARFTTKPISFWDTAEVLQQALMGLPNFVIPEVEVMKIWPLQKYSKTDGIAPPARNPSPMLQNGLKRQDILCEEWYFKYFQDNSCDRDYDCVVKFGLDSPSGLRATDVGTGNYKDGYSTTQVFCDAEISKCVETQYTNVAKSTSNLEQELCKFTDGKKEFEGQTGAQCAEYFEPDGIYLYSKPNGQTVTVWGHKLTSFERGCKIGKFSRSSVRFALACQTDKDCRPCGGWTSVRAGYCSNSGYCETSPMYSYALGKTQLQCDKSTSSECVQTCASDQVDKSACTDMLPVPKPDRCFVTSFIVKFSDKATGGTQNMLSCTAGIAETNDPGASPKYKSDGIGQCQVIRAGIPEWSYGQRIAAVNVGTEKFLKNLCYELVSDKHDQRLQVLNATIREKCTETPDGGRHISAFHISQTHEYSVEKIDNQFAENTGNYPSYNLDAVVADQSVYLASLEETDTFGFSARDLTGLKYPNDPLYLPEQVDKVFYATYAETTPCGNHGTCSSETGLCTCDKGYTGDACAHQIKFA